jgi:chemotaxis protein MotB
MALVASRRRDFRADYWPGFVDAMATLLLVIIFLLSLFMLAQFFLSQEISGKESALSRLNAQIAELTQLLALERASSTEQADEASLLEATLAELKTQRDSLQGALVGERASAVGAGGRVERLESELDTERTISEQALARVDLLNQQLIALRRQLAALEDALDVSENRDRESQTRIADLGRRLNTALAQRVQELSRYRSDFFGRLREILSNRAGVQVVGDRFVFQSEVLFPSGSAELNAEGREQLDTLGQATRSSPRSPRSPATASRSCSR